MALSARLVADVATCIRRADTVRLRLVVGCRNRSRERPRECSHSHSPAPSRHAAPPAPATVKRTAPFVFKRKQSPTPAICRSRPSQRSADSRERSVRTIVRHLLQLLQVVVGQLIRRIDTQRHFIVLFCFTQTTKLYKCCSQVRLRVGIAGIQSNGVAEL